MADLKLKGPSFDALTAIAEATGPSFVASMLHKKAAPHKNPKILSEVLNWMAQAIEEFGLQCFVVKSLLDWAKEDLGSANAGVRNSAVRMLGIMHKWVLQGFVSPAAALPAMNLPRALITEQHKKRFLWLLNLM